jgi:ATP-dependent protease ClpP protease subunit
MKLFVLIIIIKGYVSYFVPLTGTLTRSSILKTSYLLTNTYPTPVLYLNTIGGDVHAGIHLMNVLLEMNNVTCIAKKAHSMGFAIFQTCKYRYILPDSDLMQHQIQLRFKGTLSFAVLFIQNTVRIHEWILEIQASKLKVPSKLLDIRLLLGDWYLNSSEAITYNCADKII